MSDTGYLWYDKENGAILQAQHGPAEFEAIQSSVDNAEQFLLDWLENYDGGLRGDQSRFVLLELDGNEIQDGEDAITNQAESVSESDWMEA